MTARRWWPAALISALPHVLIAIAVAHSAATKPQDEPNYAGYLYYLELYILPCAVIAGIVMAAIRPVWLWGLGILAGTIGGLLLMCMAGAARW
ncbi:hypothetical protein EV385_4671 [Krasilnikovia cinnamomea]|uniref:Uncharacterized protein n=1 Tax=Krasilnikovia cinnamomea TaxID=349313 RepID=A0A4Q7ZP05_9ACTN|nr:hypothetical protein EV385_4671 [Krasilnikovia cinnamomea]